MNGLAVFQQDYSQVSAPEIMDLSPMPDTAVFLEFYTDRIADRALDPLVANDNSVRKVSVGSEMPGGAHARKSPRI